MSVALARRLVAARPAGRLRSDDFHETPEIAVASLLQVEELCNRVAIIRKGKIIYQGELRELLATAASGYRLHAQEPDRARPTVLAIPNVPRKIYGRCRPWPSPIVAMHERQALAEDPDACKRRRFEEPGSFLSRKPTQAAEKCHFTGGEQRCVLGEGKRILERRICNDIWRAGLPLHQEVDARRPIFTVDKISTDDCVSPLLKHA